MIKTARSGKEIAVTVVNKIGVLADISKTLSEHGINLDAVSGYALGKEAKITFLADDAQRALDALKKSGYKSIKENEVLVLEIENKPGALKNITESLAAQGVDIKQIYGTACVSGCPAKVVISTSDNNKALVCFRK